jgi:acetate kinase
MNILVPNLGSTSLKYQLLEMPSERVLTRGRLERLDNYREAIAEIQVGDTQIDAVVFKTVHGGMKYRGTFLIDDDVIAALQDYQPAAPAHNRIYLSAISAFREILPGVPLVAAFETEFHATMPEFAARYGVPAEWLQDYGIRRYGFHGASHRYVSERVAGLWGRPKEDFRLVSCHLGGSSSVCAIDRGRSVDTTMGFSPQSGVENATRHGDFDVFAVLYLMERLGWSIRKMRRQLACGSGLAGLSGVQGGDVRDLEQAASDGNADAALALEVFTYQVRKTIGAYAAAMGGIDALVFTGGIGENSPRLRASCCSGLGFLGVKLDPVRNEQGEGDRIVSSDDSTVSIFAVATNEELILARRGYALLCGTSIRSFR